jgi:hypothetical protein
VQTKRVSYHGLVDFNLPADWVVEVGEDCGTFYLDQPDSGTLRLHFMSFEHPDAAALSDLEPMFAHRAQQYGGSFKVLDNGDVLLRYDESRQEDGADLLVRHWQIGMLIPPSLVQVAVFSYTLLADQAQSEELAWLEEQIESAVFH